MLGRVGEVSGPKRKQNLLDHAEDARCLKAARDDPSATSRSSSTHRRGLASRARPLACARGLSPVRVARPAAAPGRGAGRPGGCGARAPGPRSSSAAACAPARPPTPWPASVPARTSSRSSCCETETPEGELFAEGPAVAFRRCRHHRQRRRGARQAIVTVPSRLSRWGPGARLVVAHDAKALGRVPPGSRARHAARRLPARARPPLASRSMSYAKSAASPAISRIRSPQMRCCCARSPLGSASRSPSAASIV